MVVLLGIRKDVVVGGGGIERLLHLCSRINQCDTSNASNTINTINTINCLFVCSFVSQNTNAPYESTNQPTDGTIKKQIGRHYKQKKNKKSKDLTALVLKLLAGPDYFSKDEIPLSTGVSMIGIVVSVPDNSTMHYDDCTIVVFRLDPHQKVVCVDTNSTVEKI